MTTMIHPPVVVTILPTRCRKVTAEHVRLFHRMLTEGRSMRWLNAALAKARVPARAHRGYPTRHEVAVCPRSR